MRCVFALCDRKRWEKMVSYSSLAVQFWKVNKKPTILKTKNANLNIFSKQFCFDTFFGKTLNIKKTVFVHFVFQRAQTIIFNTFFEEKRNWFLEKSSWALKIWIKLIKKPKWFLKKVHGLWRFDQIDQNPCNFSLFGKKWTKSVFLLVNSCFNYRKPVISGSSKVFGKGQYFIFLAH